MQWAVQDSHAGAGANHAGLDAALQGEISAMDASKDMVTMQRRGFEAVRDGMDGTARLAKAVECKVEGNAHFKQKAWMPALSAYVAGIWFIRRGSPECPAVVANSGRPSADLLEVPAALGAGEPSLNMKEAALEPRLIAERDALRLSLHLNLAASALKLEQWLIARTACEYVLMIEGKAAAPPKAAYRLAQALDGERDYARACEVLESLVAREQEDNADAEKLLAAIRKKMAPREAVPPVAAQAPTPVVPEVTQSAQNPAASPSGRKAHGPAPKRDYSRLGAEEWAAMSLEEQEEAMRQVNAELDDEMGEEPDWDNSALKALGARN